MNITPGGRMPVDEILTSILRGAAKILGCNSANLLIFNTPRQRIKAQVGIVLGKETELRGVEKLFGVSLAEHEFTFAQAYDTIIYKAWKERRAIEAGSLVELASGAFPTIILKGIDALIGRHRFIVVPVVAPVNLYGVIIFEKASAQPFSPQQRELLIGYARRIGEIIENDTRSSILQEHRRESEELLARRENAVQNQLLQIAMGESAPTLLLDPDFRITSCNETTSSLLGYADKELIGRDIGILFPPTQNIHTILNHQFLFFSDGRYEEAAAVLTKSGEQIPCTIEALLLADEKSHVVGFMMLLRRGSEKRPIGRDETHRQERLASMGEMAAQLAHEIRNPILAIGATLESLAKDRIGQRDEALFTMLAKEIVRLDMILKDYLSLAVRQNATVTRINLSEAIAEVRELLSGMQKIGGKRIEAELPPELWAVTDYEGMKHVFFNLILNAIEISPPQAAVVCRAAQEEDRIVVTVDDEGPGLPADAGDIFAPFFTTKKNGTGLGLTVCKKIIEAHGGTIALENRPEGGCRATVSLPRRSSP